MKFATLGHLMTKNDIEKIPKDWVYDKWIYSQQINLNGTKGHITGLRLSAKEIMSMSLDNARQEILELAIFLQESLDVNLIQLGALTTSVTSGGKWFLVGQKEYNGYVNHGDSYTAAVTCQNVQKILQTQNKKPSDQHLAIIGAYGIIGEAISKILVPQFNQTTLIGRRTEKLNELTKKIKGNYETTTQLTTTHADIIVTATSHPTALLTSKHLKKNAIIVDVSQPVNLTEDVCKKRPDIIRVDGGYVDLPENFPYHIPGIPKGKIFSCVAEVIMQSMENQHQNHVGSIDINHLRKTEKWAEKYQFTLKKLTNFGRPLAHNKKEKA